MKNNMSAQEQAAAWLKALTEATRGMTMDEVVVYKVPNPDKEVLRAAIKTKPACITHLQEQPDEDILLEAVNTNGYAIFRIKNPSDAVKRAAVKNQRGAFMYIENPSIETQVLALTYGLDPGCFDSENLACYGDRITDEALARVNPALITLRQLYEDVYADHNDIIEFYDAMQPLGRDVPAVALPASIEP